MKIFYVIAAVAICFFAAVCADSLSKLKNGSPITKEVVRKCITSYKINPDALWVENNQGSYIYDTLTGEQQGCVTACIYKGFNWLREDGSMDVDTLFEIDDDDTEEEKAEATREKAKYVKDVDECRAAAGKNDCKLFFCLERRGR